MGVHDPRVPERMTGGVDLTGSVDLDSPEKVADYLAGLNAQPDVIQTISGGVNDLAISVGDLPDHDGSKGFREDKEHTEALAEIRGAYDGVNVRVLPNSRFRTMRLTLAAGATAWIAQRDSRRRALGVWIIDPSAGISSAFLGPDITTVLTTGVQLTTGTGAPYSFVMTHADQVAVGAAAGNANAITVNVAFEIME